MPKLSSVLAALGISAFAWTGVAGAATTTYVQTSDNCTGGCGLNAGNFITVDQSGGLTTITVNLATGWAFVDTGANGGGGSVNFGFGSSLAGLTVTNLSGNGWELDRRPILCGRRHARESIDRQHRTASSP